MTKILTINSEPKRKTVFTKILNYAFEVKDSENSPDSFDNVIFIGHDRCYGDVFKAYDDGDEEDFTLFFGVAGNEFNQ